MTITNLKELAEIGAIFIGGIWTYFLFVRRRLGYPNAELQHNVEVHAFPSKNAHEDHYHIRVTVLIKNPSAVLLVFRSAEIRLAQVLPLAPLLQKAVDADQDIVAANSTEAAFPMLGRRCWKDLPGEVEPAGIGHLIADFTIPKHIKTIEVYSHVESRKPRNNNMWDWMNTTLHDIKGEEK